MSLTLDGFTKWFEIAVLKIAIFALILAACQSCQPSPIERFNDWMGWRDDNIAEEALEFVIEKEAGIDFDLSPRSPE